ncbi:MAG TPA: DAK2 domain-containing protein [Ilumatobacteraceae bacterium]
MPTLERLSADALRDTVITFRDTMRAHAQGINRLNVYPVPDGDTGTNMARTLDAVVAELETTDVALGPTCAAISHGSLMGARGNSGVILSQILRGIANTLKDATDATATKVAESLKNASTAAYQAVLRPIEGTILTVVRETADAAQASAADGASLAEMLRAARDAGRSSLARTPELLPVLRDAGVVDAGGAGFMLLLDSAIHVVDGEALPVPDEVDASDVFAGEQFDATAHRGTGDVSGLRYEVMYFLDLGDDRIGEFKQSWGAIGDSIVVVGGDGLWNCHVHTNDIGAAIESALVSGGRPHKIRVTDLFEEVAEEHAQRESAMNASASGAPPRRGAPGAGMPAVTCAVVAVASGEGLSELFAQLGVQGVVTGGQTLNPSTAELLAAVEAVNADQVIVLPNNKNIIPVAEQVGSLTTKVVVVVPTRSMPEALAALIVYDPEAPAAHNGMEMSAAAESVATGEVTQAIRDTASEAGQITAGDWIGIVRGDGIVAVNGTLIGAATALLDHLITPEREIVTLIAGLDASRSATDALQAWLADERPDVTVEVHHGGQPLYPYLFGVE